MVFTVSSQDSPSAFFAASGVLGFDATGAGLAGCSGTILAAGTALSASALAPRAAESAAASAETLKSAISGSSFVESRGTEPDGSGCVKAKALSYLSGDGGVATAEIITIACASGKSSVIVRSMTAV